LWNRWGTWHMRIAYRITQATYPFRVSNTYCFSTAKMDWKNGRQYYFIISLPVLSPLTTVFPCQYHSDNAPNLFINLTPTVCYLTIDRQTQQKLSPFLCTNIQRYVLCWLVCSFYISPSFKVHDFKNSLLNIMSKYSLQICGRNLALIELIRLFLNPELFCVLLEELIEKGCLSRRMYESVPLFVCNLV